MALSLHVPSVQHLSHVSWEDVHSFRHATPTCELGAPVTTTLHPIRRLQRLQGSEISPDCGTETVLAFVPSLSHPEKGVMNCLSILVVVPRFLVGVPSVTLGYLSYL